MVSAIQWLPHRKGVVAVACTEATSHAERVGQAGRPQYAYILVWNFKDPINPEYVLQVGHGGGEGKEECGSLPTAIGNADPPRPSSCILLIFRFPVFRPWPPLPPPPSPSPSLTG